MTIPMIAHAGPGPHGEPTNVTKLREIMFAEDWPGYKPEVREIPDGQGEVDQHKRYSHISLHDLDKYDGEHKAFLTRLYNQAYKHAVQYYEQRMGLGDQAIPAIEECCLRLSEYPPGVGGEAHTDFDLFTMNLWRSHRDLLIPRRPVHYGELLELLTYDEVAHRHRIEPHETDTQVAVLFFVLPARDTKLPGGRTMGEWLDERLARSRVGA